MNTAHQRHRDQKADAHDESSLSSFLIPISMLSWQHHAPCHQILTCVQNDGCKGKDLPEKWNTLIAVSQRVVAISYQLLQTAIKSCQNLSHDILCIKKLPKVSTNMKV